MLGFIKAVIGVIVLAVVLTVAWPYLESAFPNTTGAVPDALVDDMKHIGNAIGEQAGMAAEQAGGAAVEGLKQATDSLMVDSDGDGIPDVAAEGLEQATGAITEGLGSDDP